MKPFLWAKQMYYYQHNIGDFDKKTRHLTRIERSVYLDMIHLYYTTEQELPLDVATICRKVLARDDEEKAAVVAVLDEFFDKTPTGWYHDRCEEELDAYRKTKTQASAAGKASAAAKLARKEQALNGNSTTVPTEIQRNVNSEPTKHKPITSKQETVTKNQEPEYPEQQPRSDAVPASPPAKRVRKTAEPSLCTLPPWLPLDAWNAFLEMRKKIKKPPTNFAQELLLKKLAAFYADDHDPAVILNQSIMNGWQDLYAPKQESIGRYGGAPRLSVAEQNRANNISALALLDQINFDNMRTIDEP